MIAATILTACMALPSAAQYYGDNPLVSDQANFAQQILHIAGPVLLVGSDPNFINVFRYQGLPAFGAFTQDWPGTPRTVTSYAVTDPGKISFLPQSFQYVLWEHANFQASEPHLEWLLDALALVSSGGFLAYDLDVYPAWEHALKDRSWHLLPFRMGSLHIFQRPVGDNGRTIRTSA